MSTPVAFIPFLILYLNGAPTHVVIGKEPIQTQAECMESAQAAVNHVQEGGMPEGEYLLGGCLPIPPVPPTAPNKPQAKGPVTKI